MPTSIGTIEGTLRLRDRFTSPLQRATAQLVKSGKQMQATGARMTAAGASLTRALTVPIALIGIGSVKAAANFESSFAGVRKTVNATEQEFSALARGMRDLSKEIPVNVNELNRIGEAAGQLGIRTENILSFTRVIADLGVTTNLTAEQAGSALARIANITGLAQTEFDRLGSTIVALGNTSATTEAEIVDFGLRIAGAGEISGLTEAQILGIGAAMSSVGVQAEAGGTSVQKVLLGMTKSVATADSKLEIFARTAGMTAAQFSEAFERDAGGAFAAFVEGLGRQGTKAFKTLEDLNLSDQRLIRSFLSLAGAGDLVSRTMDTATRAFEENSALAKEAEERYKTFASQMTKLVNKVRDAAITFGTALMPVIQELTSKVLVPAIEKIASMAKRFGELPIAIRNGVVAFFALVAVVGPLLIVLGGIVSVVGFAVSGLAALAGTVTVGGVAIAALVATLGFVVVAITTTTDWVGRARDAFSEWWVSTEKGRRFMIELARVIGSDVVTVIETAVDWVVKYTKLQIAWLKVIVESVKRGLEWSGILLVIKTHLVIVSGVVTTTTKKFWELAGGVQGLIETAKVLTPVLALISKKLDGWKERARLAAEQIRITVTATERFSGSVNEGTVSIEEMNKATEAALGPLKSVAKAVGEVSKEVDNLSSKSLTRLRLPSFTGQFSDFSEEIERNHQRLAILSRTAIDADRSLGDLAIIINDLRTALINGVITQEQYLEALKRINFEAERGPKIFTDMGQAFANAIAQSVIDARSLGDSLRALFEGKVRASMVSFITEFISGFKKAKEAGVSAANSIVGAFKGLSSAGQIGAVIAVVAIAVSIFKSLSGSMRTATDVAREFGLELSENLLARIDAVAAGIKDLDAAFLLLLGDTIREVGIKNLGELGRFMSLIRDLMGELAGATAAANESFENMAETIDDAFDSSLTQAEVVIALGDALVALVDRFEEVGGGLGSFNALADIFVDLFDKVTEGTVTAAEASEILGRTWLEMIKIAIGLGEAAAASIQRIVEAAQAAGVDSAVFAEALELAYAEAFDVIERRNAFLIAQASELIRGVEIILSATGKSSRREIEFTATAVLAAFNAMVEAGAPILDILDKLGDAFATILERGMELGIELPEAFLRLGEILDIIGSRRMTTILNMLEGVTAATGALGNMGLLSASQFDFFGDSIRKAFRRLIAQGLSTEEALAILAPQLQLLNDLSQQYGFTLDRNTQSLLDQAIAQGLVADKGLTMEDILIEGFNRLLIALNALIEAMGGVPVAFEEWGAAADRANGQISRLTRTIGNVSVVDFGPRDIPDTGGNRISAAGGTGGLRNFGLGTPAILHGREEVLTARQGSGVAGMVASALSGRGGDDAGMKMLAGSIDDLGRRLLLQQRAVEVERRDEDLKSRSA